MPTAAYPCELPAAERRRLIAALQARYARLDPAQFEPDAAGRYPPLGPGHTQPVLDWIYPALHLTLEPRRDRGPQDRALARRMLLRAIRQGQVRKTGHPADGVWHWNLSDASLAADIDREYPRDRNTAGFMGCGLVRIWANDPQKLGDWPAADLELFRDAVRRSIHGGLRWWVRVGYTNPQCLDFYLGYVAADLLNDGALRDQTREHLHTFLQYARTTDVFEEYLSPTYMAVNFTGLIPLAHYAATAPDGHPAKADAPLLQELAATAWQHVAAAAHAPTAELCGPHARAYGDTAIERADCLYAWLHLAAPKQYPLTVGDGRPVATVAKGGFVDWFQRDPAVFEGLAAPGLYLPLGLPKAVRKELTAGFRRPVEQRQLTEWIGRCGWTPPYDLSKPRPPVPRFRLATRYRTSQFCLGSINEQDSWLQRRPIVAYWKAADGRTTGVKWFVQIDGGAEAARFLGDWLFQQAFELVSLQGAARVIGAWRTGTVVDAHPGDRLQAPAGVSGLSQANFTPQKPVGWFLGSHWRQAIEPAWQQQTIARVTVGLAPIGPGGFEPLNATATQWRFVENGLALWVETPAGARLEAVAARTADSAPVECLTLLHEENLAWDWLRAPQLLLPFQATVAGAQTPPEWGLQVDGSAQQFELQYADLKLRWQAPAGPDQIERRTWFGTVAGEEILPAGY